MNHLFLSGAMVALVGITVGLTVPPIASAEQPPAKSADRPAGDIVEVAVKSGSFKTLAAALNAAGLVDALKGPGPFTVFAPTDAAFDKLPPGTLDSLLRPENKDKLTAILKYHVVSGEIRSSAIGSTPVVSTLNGQTITLASSGSGVTMNGSTGVTLADVAASNGVIHAIDRVLIPETRTIPALVKDDGRFGTLLAAVTAAGLAETLSGAGPFTVLAPTDEAFAKLPKPLLAALLKPENKAILAEILTYHVLNGRITSTQALRAASAPTLQASNVTIAGKPGELTVNGVRVLTTDLNASNGIGHVLDAVLIPESVKPKLARLSMSPVRRIVETAIARGVPMFNAHDPAGCAAVYEVALTALSVMPAEQMECSARSSVMAALDEGRTTHDTSDRAWVYRRALDSVTE